MTQYSTKDGLPQSRIIDIVSRENGNLIIATANGIVEYDGFEFNNFISDETYKNYYLQTLFWSATSNQLFAITNERKLKCVYPKFKSLDEYCAVHIKEDSLFTVNESGDLFVADLKNLQFKKLRSTQVKHIRALYCESNYCVLATNEGLYRYEKKSDTALKLASGNFSGIKRNRYNSKIYALSTTQAYVLNDTSAISILKLEDFDARAIAQDLEFVAEDEIYVSTTNGLYEIFPDYIDKYTKLSAFPSSYLQALFYSWQEKCLFVGTGEKGLLKLQFKNCFSFTSDQGFIEASSITSVVRNAAGKVTVGDEKGNIYQIGIDTAKVLMKTKSVCTSLAVVNKDLCIGTLNDGVLIARNNSIMDTIKFPEQLPDPTVQSIYKDYRGVIWIGTNKGLACGTSFENIKPLEASEIKSRVICFYELKNKSLCIGGSEGAFILSPDRKKWIRLGKEEGLIGKNVRTFYEDKEGKIWIGTYDGGLYCYHQAKVKSINQMKNAKLDKDAFTLAPDEFGYLYLTSNHGLWRVSEKSLSDFYYGKLDYLIPFFYSDETGIVNTEFNGGFQNNYLRTRSGHFYFPSIEGIVLVNPEEPVFRKLNPVIKQVEVNDTVFTSLNHTLNKNTFSVAFYFSCLNYLKKYNVYYQYKLESQNKSSDWSNLQKEPSITFKMLPAGRYTFSVRAIDAFNDKKPDVVTYEFEIEPEFYETYWFNLVVIFTFIVVTSFIIRMRITSFRKKAAEKERIRRQLAEFELKATHAQMNPHFIFNSLNSIKYYLSINDQKNADHYIDHFSSLLRSFLENGSKDFIELKDEIEILKSYLELEKQRMSPSFTYTIKVAPSLYHFLIPTHLIQPFVENAIKHGINHSSKECQIFIHFYTQDSYLICVIDDDGIGRIRSAEINKKRRSHQSKGLEMVLEKIRIVKEIYKLEILLNIEDKLGPDLKSLGTRVEVKIPIPANEDNNS